MDVGNSVAIRFEFQSVPHIVHEHHMHSCTRVEGACKKERKQRDVHENDETTKIVIETDQGRAGAEDPSVGGSIV